LFIKTKNKKLLMELNKKHGNCMLREEKKSTNYFILLFELKSKNEEEEEINQTLKEKYTKRE